MNDHMPGPWKWRRFDLGLQLEANVEYAEMSPVLIADKCSEDGCNSDREECVCPLEPTVEDRALIAAAPDMAEVIEALLECERERQECWTK